MKKEFLNLGRQPLANSFISKEDLNNKVENFYPLSIGFDCANYLVSLMQFVPSEEMFNANYIYHSSHSPILVDHFANIAQKIKKYVPRFGNILEIGTNDGPFLTHFGKGQGIGVEPCDNFANLMQSKGYTIYNKFWNWELAQKIKENNELFDVVYAANTMCHIPNIQEAFEGVNHILRDGGIFVFEDPSLIEILKINSYDQTYHEHVHVFSLLALQKLLANAGLEIFNVEKLSIHGGSNRVWAKKKENVDIDKSSVVDKYIMEELNYGLHRWDVYERFTNRVQRSRVDLYSLLSALKGNNKNIVAFGATSKLNVVLNYCGINQQIITCIIDEMPSKYNLYSPGTHIPVVPFDRKQIKDIDYVLLGCWNFKDEIVRKLKINVNWNGYFVSHVPNVHIF